MAKPEQPDLTEFVASETVEAATWLAASPNRTRVMTACVQAAGILSYDAERFHAEGTCASSMAL